MVVFMWDNIGHKINKLSRCSALLLQVICEDTVHHDNKIPPVNYYSLPSHSVYLYI